MSERARPTSRLPALMIAVLLSACQSLASADAPVTTSKRGRKLAQAAVEMIREVLATGLPRRVPESMRDELPGQEFEGNRRRQPAWAFFVPEVLSDEAPGLCRRAERFWSTSPKKLVEAIPFLGPMYLCETDPMRSAILDTILGILEQAISPRRFRTLAEPTCLSILKGTTEDDRRQMIVWRCLEQIAPLSPNGTAEVLRLATEDDADTPEVLCEEIKLLDTTASHGPADPSLRDFLLHFLESSGSGECRGWAVDSALLKRYGKDRVLPVYLRVLREVWNSDPILARNILIEISLDLSIPEVTPVLVEALRSELPAVRLQAAVGLEHTTGLGPREMGYVAERDVASVGVVTGEIRGGMGRAELELICARWEKWWETAGAEFMLEHGLNRDGTPLSGHSTAASPVSPG